MPGAPFRVVLTAAAESDLDELDAYWRESGEPWRGDQYFDDLTEFAQHNLSDPQAAARGRRLKSKRHPNAREVLAFGVYRVIYEIDDGPRMVRVLRFWHAHRDNPSLD